VVSAPRHARPWRRPGDVACTLLGTQPSNSFRMDTDEDTDEEHEDAPLVASDEQSRREARLRHEPTVWSDDPLANVTLVLLLLLALGGGILTGFYGFDVLMRLASLVRCATPSSPARVAAEPARAAAATIKRPAESADSPVGHEWYGGAVGGSEGAGHDARWGPAQQEPRHGRTLPRAPTRARTPTRTQTLPLNRSRATAACSCSAY